MKLRFRIPGAPAPKEYDIDGTTAVGMLPFLLEEALGVPGDFIGINTGFPPKPLTADPSTPIEQLFKEGEMLIAVKRAGEGDADRIKRGVTDGKYVPPSDKHSFFIVRKVPADNSCCFHSCAYVLKDKSRSGASGLRQQVAEAVMMHPQKFTTAYLGQRNEEYVRWIMNPDTWGGAIELDILSFLYQTVIHALDLESLRSQSFGKDQGYTTEAYVVYTGTHYDALAMTKGAGGIATTSGGPESEDQVLFNPRDEHVAKAAQEFINSVKNRRIGGR